MKRYFLLLTILMNAMAISAQGEESDKIVGVWKSPDKNLMIKIDKIGDQFQGRIVWVAQNGRNQIQLDENNPDAYIALSYLNLMRKKYEQAIASAKRAVILNPNGADAYAILGYILYNADRLDDAVQYLEKAIRLNPFPPSSYYHFLGHVYVALDDFNKAIAAYKRAIEIEPSDLFAHVGLTGTYVLSGRFDEAQSVASEVLRIDPEYSTDKFEKTSSNKNKVYIKRFYGAVRQAGLK